MRIGIFVPALGALGALGAIGLIAASCGYSLPEYDHSYPGAPCDRGYAVCETDQECFDAYEKDTFCIDSRCKCPVEGYIICNKKGHPPDNNIRGCHDPSDCEPGGVDEVCFDGGAPDPTEEPDAAADAGADADAAAPLPLPECTVDDVSKCAGLPDKRCGLATCVDGVCALNIAIGPIASQKAGDCKQSLCDAAGKVIEVEDPSDYYEDGAECTFDYCGEDGKVNASMHSITCPDTSEGYCSNGACVQCIVDFDCNLTEDCMVGRCMPKTCNNNMVDPPESDVDCGGKCLLCASGEACTLDSDCKSNVCKNLQCEKPSCDDMQKNDGETDTDCGNACKDPAKLCSEGQGCETGADCESGVCWAAKCQAPKCTDGVQNAKETGIDCGGDCPDC